jgi:hypothetical protein
VCDGENAAEKDQSVQRGIQGTAVGLSSLPGVLIQDVASSSDIHPFMLSRWRKEVRVATFAEVSASDSGSHGAKPTIRNGLSTRHQVLA